MKRCIINCKKAIFAYLTFLWVLVTFISEPCKAQTAAPSTTSCSNNQTSYDFIIIGGGTAGLTISTRLNQNLPNLCILILEASQEDGRDEPKIYIPGLKGSTIGTKYDWNLTTIPQTNASDRRFAMTRGKVLGGSSALNLMTWDRGSRADYDAWEDLGNPGWNWESMYESMLKVENFSRSVEYDVGEEGDQGGVGFGGPIQTLINRILPEHQKFFPLAMENLGVRGNNQSLDGFPIGVERQPSNIRQSNYTRSYSPTYLELANENLILRLGTRVSWINFNGTTAIGVTLEDGTVINASKEVILSAGSLQSPGLLEISGIGNKDILKAAGINQTIYHLPGVGENLQDHIRVQNSYQLKPGYLSFDILRYNTTFATEQMALYNASKPSEYDYTGSGYAYLNWSQVSNNNNNTTGTTKLIKLAQESANITSPIDKRKLSYLTDPNLSSQVPQLEVIFSDGYTGVKGYPSINSSLYGSEFFTLIASIQHPFSHGSVHITTSSITDPPIINPNYLSHPYDLAAAKTAARYLRKVASTAPLSTVWTTEYEPGLIVSSDSDEEWEAYVRNTTLSIYHPIGTCAMLPESDGGVVSPELKVYGTKGLRVVDASVMPILISAHIQTAVYGIAERAAGIILEQWMER